MTFLKVSTPFNIDLEFKIARFGKRFAAWLIDIFLICVYYYVMLRIIYPLFSVGETVITAAYYLLLIIPVILYQLVFEIAMNGQTLGKKAVGIKVMDKEGQEPSVGQYVIRWILNIGNLFIYTVPIVLVTSPAALPFLVLFYNLPDFLCIMISRKSQRLGDLAAGTVMIDRNYVPDLGDTIHLDVEKEAYKPQYPEVMRLTDRDINGIRNLLKDARPGKEQQAYTRQVTVRIKEVLAIDSELDDVDFLQQLLVDYNYFTALK